MDFAISRNASALGFNGKMMGRYHNTDLPPYTLRIEFSDSTYNPTSESGWKGGSTWTKVQGISQNRWDWTYTNPDWSSAFYNKLTYPKTLPIKVIDGNTSEVTNMSSLFSGCNALTEVCLFETSNVTSTSNMFGGCSNLEGVVPLYDTRNVTDMSSMFSGCYRITEVPLFNTHNVTNMSYAFYSCDSITTVPRFDTRNVTSMSGMFHDCASLVSVPVFDTHNVTSISGMFEESRALTTVPLFNTDSMLYTKNAFRNCVNVTGGALALYQRLAAQIPNPTSDNWYTFSNCGSNTTTGRAELSQIPAPWNW